MKLVTLFVVLMGLFLVSCEEKSNGKPRKGPDVGGNTPGLTRTPVSSFGKTAKEILAVKYDKADMECDLWVEKSKELNTDTASSNSTRRNLMEGIPKDGSQFFELIKSAEAAFSSQEQLTAGLASQTMKIDGELLELKLLSSIVANESGLYKLTYVLRLKVKLDVSVTTKYSDASPDLTEKSSHTVMIIEVDPANPEKNVVTPLNSSMLLGDGVNSIFKHLKCSFKTTIKPNFLPADETLDQII